MRRRDTHGSAAGRIGIHRALDAYRGAKLANNALKHARASQILVQIIQEPDRIAFTVQDDGCGFDPSAASEGMGLANIRTRVASFGGIMNIVSTADEGTEINVEIQLI